MWVYQIRNTINNKIYVGKCKCLKTRWKRHLKALSNNEKKNSKIYSAMKKYGIENFLIEPIFFVLNSKEINEFERFFIKELKTKKLGYNIRDGGDGGGDGSAFKEFNEYRKGKTNIEIYGKEQAEKMKQKQSKSLTGIFKGRKVNFDTRKKISDSLKYKWKNDKKYRSRMEKINKEKSLSGENHHMYGKKHSEEAKKCMSKFRLGKTYEEIMGNDKAKVWRETKSKNMKGENNPVYKILPVEDILNHLIENRYEKMDTLAKKFRTSRPTISKRFKELFDINNIQEYRSIMSKEDLIYNYKGKLYEILHKKQAE